MKNQIKCEPRAKAVQWKRQKDVCHIDTLTAQWVEQKERMSLVFINDQKYECIGRTSFVDSEQFEWDQ